MAKQIELKYRRLMIGRTSLENELSVVHSHITESLEGPIRKTKINASIESCKSILEKGLAKNDDLVILANKTDKPSNLLSEFAAWWDRIVKINDESAGKAGTHMESNQASEICVSETSRSKVSSKSAKTEHGKLNEIIDPHRAPQRTAPSEDEARRVGKTT